MLFLRHFMYLIIAEAAGWCSARQKIRGRPRCATYRRYRTVGTVGGGKKDRRNRKTSLPPFQAPTLFFDGVTYHNHVLGMLRLPLPSAMLVHP
ncbi:hypothetical protein F4803DRAFT_167621 [Xylaria telfairii]|nr:hypothetical protein F4803DRAFT_167621 [Xylaria telfairii]